MAPRKKAPDERWLWYTQKTSDCVPLDREAYPTTVYDHWTVPWPEWACKAPDGGIHIDNRIGRIDVHVAEPPNGRDEFNWTCDFGVFVVSREWFTPLEDLVDSSRIFLGSLYRNGLELSDWATIHETSPPSLRSTKGASKVCPICGDFYTVIRGGVYFCDPAILGRPLIVDRGIFVREDEVIRRNLRPPVGAFKPGIVKFRESPPDPVAAPLD